MAQDLTIPAQHQRRFAVVYAGVTVVAIAGIVGFLLLAGGSPLNDKGPAWSAWKPSGGGLGAAKQIAAHVAPTYRLANGMQLLDPIARGPDLSANGQTIPLPLIAVRGPKGKVDQVYNVSPGDSVSFSLCGLGPACSIATGKASAARATLVRREILEIALYTFKYVPSIKNVLAFMPPPAGAKPTSVVYLQKSDLEQELKTPLARTLNPNVPLPSAIGPGEEQRIVGLTDSRIYKFGVSQTQQGEPILVLNPFAA